MATNKKKTNKQINKKVTIAAKKVVVKTAKKNPIAVIIFAIVAAIVIATCIIVLNKKDWLRKEIVLNGESTIGLDVGDTYEELGAKASYNGTDISDKIQIKYKLQINEETTEEVDQIETTDERKYVAEYSVSHENWSSSIQREIYVGVEPISINFLELGNKKTGDCTYIKAGNTDILIDAGSIKSSAETIANFLNQPGRVDDGVLEYVIATHAHEDHISGFIGTAGVSGILLKYEVGTLIQFSQTNAKTDLYNDFERLVERAKKKGTTVLGADQAVGKKFQIANSTYFEVLDQKYYHEVDSDENNHSVCTLFTQLNNHYLFTGDLEASGEASLVELNPNLPHVQLFKGGHHGSYTANTDTLLSKITPEVVCICCCAGTDEYTKVKENQFPAQVTVNRIAKYTDAVYVTSVIATNSAGYKSMNGNILFYCEKGKEYSVKGSDNSTKLKDQQWFKSNRTCPNEWK